MDEKHTINIVTSSLAPFPCVLCITRYTILRVSCLLPPKPWAQYFFFFCLCSNLLGGSDFHSPVVGSVVITINIYTPVYMQELRELGLLAQSGVVMVLNPYYREPSQCWYHFQSPGSEQGMFLPVPSLCSKEASRTFFLLSVTDLWSIYFHLHMQELYTISSIFYSLFFIVFNVFFFLLFSLGVFF